MHPINDFCYKCKNSEIITTSRTKWLFCRKYNYANPTGDPSYCVIKKKFLLKKKLKKIK